MAMSKGFFETLDSEIVGGQTTSDILYWILGGVLLFDFMTGGIIFTTWFSNFGLSEKAFAGVQIVLIGYCAAMVFGESKAVKNVITTIGFWTLLFIATAMTNSNSKIMDTFDSIRSGVGGITSGGNNYVQTPQGLVNPPPRIVQPEVNNDLRKWNNIGAAQGLRKLQPLDDAGLKWCATSGNAYNQARLHCKTKYKWTSNNWSKLNTQR